MGQPRGQRDCLAGCVERSAALLKVLANNERLLLLVWLARDECDVGRVGRETGIAQPTLSQQLAVLRRAGLVSTRRVGRHIYYRTTSGEALAFVALIECGGAGPRAATVAGA